MAKNYEDDLGDDEFEDDDGDDFLEELELD